MYFVAGSFIIPVQAIFARLWKCAETWRCVENSARSLEALDIR